MRGTLGAWVVLAACSNPSGTFVTVQTDGTATRVELFLSKEACDDCSGLTPPSRATTLPPRPVYGDGWVIFDEQRFNVELESGATVARFFIENDADADIAFERGLAVGLSGPLGQETVTSAASLGPIMVPRGRLLDIPIELAPADQLDSQTQNEHVELWRRPADGDTYSACAIVQHANGDEPEFFVPANDHDCDAKGTTDMPECTDSGPVRAPWLNEASCIANDPQLLPFGMCRIGGPWCSDQPLSAPGACVPVDAHHCLSGLICEGLNSMPGDCVGGPLSERCIGALLTSSMPFTSCDAGIDGTNAPCDGTGIGRGLLDAHNIASGPCNAISIANIHLPLAFGDMAVVGEGMLATLALDQSKFDQASCTIPISWTGRAGTAAHYALLRVKTMANVYRVVALRFKGYPMTCAGLMNTVSCTSNAPSADDSILTCN
jgi:hypothetical protein